VSRLAAVEELRPCLWTWTAPHPAWTPEEGGPEGWDETVRSYALDTGDTFVLVDPLAPPSLVDELAAGREVAVVVLMHHHQRSAEEIVARLGATVYAPEAGRAHVRAPAHGYQPGDRLPGGLESRPTCYPFEAVLWIPAHGALVFADVILGGELGLHVQPDSWLDGVTRSGLRESLRPLLELPVELLLPTHGDPVSDGAAELLRELVES
jgi:glyoxylase-like metal-dependent hydrolase (beta-lactamase superfamily II)